MCGWESVVGCINRAFSEVFPAPLIHPLSSHSLTHSIIILFVHSLINSFSEMERKRASANGIIVYDSVTPSKKEEKSPVRLSLPSLVLPTLFHSLYRSKSRSYSNIHSIMSKKETNESSEVTYTSALAHTLLLLTLNICSSFHTSLLPGSLTLTCADVPTHPLCTLTHSLTHSRTHAHSISHSLSHTQ